MIIGVDIRALSNKKLTGIGKYIYHSLQNIISQDKKNQYVLISSGLKKNAYEHIKFDFPNVSYRHIKIPNKILNFVMYSGVGRGLCKKILEGLDMYWMPNLNFCGLRKDIPFVLTIHDLSFLHDREFYSLKRRYWHKMVKVGRLVRKANKIIAVSENTKRDIIRFFPNAKDKVEVINPGVDFFKMDDQKAQDLLARFRLPEKYFVYVGTLEPRKNINSIIQAIDRIHHDYPDVHLVIVGSKGWIFKHLLKNIDKRKYVHYLDYVDGPAKDALYYKSLGLVWPSFYEGFGFPPMEAIAQETPVIVSYKTSLPETLENNALYVDPYNVSDIYQNMRALLDDKNLLTQLKLGAKNFDIPSWPSQAKKIIKLFNSLKK